MRNMMVMRMKLKLIFILKNMRTTRRNMMKILRNMRTLSQGQLFELFDDEYDQEYEECQVECEEFIMRGM